MAANTAPEGPEGKEPKPQGCSWWIVGPIVRALRRKTRKTVTPEPEPPLDSPSHGTRRMDADESVKQESPRERARRVSIILLRHIRAAYGGTLPHPESPVGDMIDRIADPHVRLVLEQMAAGRNITTAGDLYESLVVMSGERRNIGALLEELRDAYPEGIPEGAPLEELLVALPEPIAGMLRVIAEGQDITTAADLIRHLEVLDRQERGESEAPNGNGH